MSVSRFPFKRNKKWYFQALQKRFPSVKLSSWHFKTRAQNTFTLQKWQFQPHRKPFPPLSNSSQCRYMRQALKESKAELKSVGAKLSKKLKE